MDGYCGVIYKATNKINGKCYIGKSVVFRHRKSSHKSASFNIKSKDYTLHFHRAIRKYGWSSFAWEILEDNIPADQLSFLETSAVYLYDSHNNGYNETDGGDGTRGHKVSEETKQKISIAHKGKPFTEEHKRNISKAKKGSVPWKKGRPCPEQRGEKNPSAKLTWEKINKIRELWLTGKYSIKELRIMFGVGKSNISLIINNKTWVKETIGSNEQTISTK